MIKLGQNVFLLPAPGGMRSFSLQQQILPIAGRLADVFLRLIGSVGGDINKLAEADVMAILPRAMPYLGRVFADMPPGELERLTRELLRDGLCDKMPLFGSPGGDAFDGLMAGRAVDTWKLLWYALGVWYPDFFILGRAFAAPGAQVSTSAASTTSSESGPAGG